MDKKEYLQTVTEQIRCLKARDAVREELAHHIDDQKEAFMMDGMKEEEASMQAVKEMGDPVEAGVTLDLVHRPKMDWKMIVFVMGLSVLGLVLQYIICTSIGTDNYNYYIWKQPRYVILGIVVMLVFCFLDYSRIGLYGKIGAVVMLILSLCNHFYGTTVNGQSGFMKVFVNFSMHQLLYLYIPLFGGILYSYKGQGKKAFYKSIAWMIAPCFAAISFSNISLAAGLFVIMMIQLGVVVKKGWIHSSKKAWSVAIGITVAVVAVCLGYFVFGGTQEADGYLMQTTRGLLKESIWIGQGTGEIADVLIDININFIITYVISTYGIFPAILLMGMLGFFICWIVKMSVGQKNQLGMIMGVGCSLVFAIQSILYLLVNVSVLPATVVFLPLFSYGGTGTLVSFALIGILLSIYRYQNVLPISPYKRAVALNRKQVQE